MRVQKYNTADVLIEYYDEAFSYLSNQSIKAELPIFAGFYAGEEFYYVVWGKNNLKEYDSNEVIRVVKYNKNWERLSQCSVYGANTKKPFSLGTLRMTECNGYLFVRTTHQMYASEDDLNHQANMALQIRTADMVLTDSAYDISNYALGYVSHCFNTFIMTDDTNHILTLDQGDGAPRGAMIGRYSKIPGEYCLSGSYRPLLTFSYDGQYGQNTTHATLGDFSYSDSSILVAGTSINYDEQLSTRTIQNLYLSVTDRTELETYSINEESNTTKIRWITNYKDNVKDEHFRHCATTPYLIRWNHNLFLLIWSDTKYDEPTGNLFYEFIDGEGKQIGEIHSEKGNISDCKPIMKGNKVVWYTTNNEKLCFYSIDQTGTLKKNTVTYPKQIDVFPKSVKECRLAITKIGQLKKNQVNSSYVLTFRGKPLKKEKDYFIRGDGYSWNSTTKIISKFSKTICGMDGDFYGTHEFTVFPIRKKAILKSVAATSSVATVKWEKGSGCMGYEIYRSVDGKKKQKVAVITNPTIGSWKDTNVQKGHYYSYSMRAYTKKGSKMLYTNKSDEITALPGNAKAFLKPKITSIKQKGNKIIIKISKNKMATGYEYQFSWSQDFDVVKKQKTTSSNMVTISDDYFGCEGRVRMYRKVKGKKVYGPWSKVYLVVNRY